MINATIKIIFIISVLITLNSISGCNSTKITSPQTDFFNKEAFTGLVQLTNNINDTLLEYELDKPDGTSIKITSCKQTNDLTDSDITPHQYKLYQLLIINCYAAKKYLTGNPAKQSYFDNQSLLNIILNLPATAVPDLGGNSLDTRKNKSLKAFESSIKIGTSSDNSISVTLTDNIHIEYVLLAKKDINKDGFENIILRLDWYIPDTFGSGSVLIALEKKSKQKPIGILWRYH